MISLLRTWPTVLGSLGPFRFRHFRFMGTANARLEKSWKPAAKIEVSRTYNRWTTQEVEKLKYAVQKYGDWDWVRVAMDVESRSAIQCQLKWKRSLKPGIRLGKWTPVEDQLLLNVIKQEIGEADKSSKSADQENTTPTDPVISVYAQSPEAFLHDSLNNHAWDTNNNSLDTNNHLNEDSLLNSLSSMQRGFWTRIASKLNVGRSSYQCFIRYDQLTARKYVNKPWTFEEMNRLRWAVDKINQECQAERCHQKHKTIADATKWRLIAELMPGRTKGMCMRRWKQVQSQQPSLTDNTASEKRAVQATPVKRYEQWTEDEFEKLKEAVEKYGTARWSFVAAHVGTRNSVQCLQKWKFCLQEGRKKGQWSPEETKTLLELSRKYDTYLRMAVDRGSIDQIRHSKYRWIAHQLGNRTTDQCRTRLTYLKFKENAQVAWTPEETQTLQDLVSRLEQPYSGGLWMSVAKMLGNRRTATEYRLKWHEIARKILS